MTTTRSGAPRHGRGNLGSCLWGLEKGGRGGLGMVKQSQGSTDSRPGAMSILGVSSRAATGSEHGAERLVEVRGRRSAVLVVLVLGVLPTTQRQGRAGMTPSRGGHSPRRCH